MSFDIPRELLASIDRVNREGTPHFTIEATLRCNGVEAAGELDYRVIARPAGTQLGAIQFRAVAVRVPASAARFIVAARAVGYHAVELDDDVIAIEPVDGARLGASDWPDGVEQDTGGYLRGLAPDRVDLGARPALAEPAPGRAITQQIALRFRGEVELTVDGQARGGALVTGAWDFFLREWGLKEVYVTWETVEPRQPEALAGLGLVAGPTVGTFALADYQGVTARVLAVWSDSALHLTMRGVALRRRRRPERSTVYKLRARQIGSEPLSPSRYSLEPALPETAAELVRAIETERDPNVAAQAVYLVGAHRLAAATDAVIACLLHPDEAPEVVHNALWAVVRLGAAAAWPAVVQRAATDDDALAALAALDPARALAWLTASGPRGAAYLAAHPELAHPAVAPAALRHQGAALTGYPHAVAVHPAGTHFVVGMQRAMLIGERARPDAAQLLACDAPNLEAIAFAPDGRSFAVANVATGLELWDWATRRRTAVWDPGQTLARLAFSPDGTQLACSSYQRTWLWDVATGTPRALAHRGDVAASAWLPDGTVVATTEDAILRWRSRKAEVLARGVELRKLAVTTSALAAVSGGKRIALWTHAGAPAGELVGHAEQIIGLVAAGDLLASCDHAGQVILWDAAARRQCCAWRAHEGRVIALAFSADARWLVTTGIDDKRVEVWDVAAALGRG